MFGFDAYSFAIAGLVAAASPLLIHLFNRRRFRQVEWAAMDFLRKAIERQKRILHLRDWLLLILRMSALICLGLALARPWISGGSAWVTSFFVVAGLVGVAGMAAMVINQGFKARAVAATVSLFSLFSIFGLWWSLGAGNTGGAGLASSLNPVHAILILDNSRSMGAGVISGTRWDAARKSSLEFLSSLPPGSRATVLPLAGSSDSWPTDPFRSMDDARQAIEQIRVADTIGSPRLAAELALEASRTSTDLPVKRVVIFSDLQGALWKDASLKERFEELADVQIVPCGTADSGNVHIASLAIEDGLISVETPARIIARIEAGADQAPTTVYARLLADRTEVANQVIPLLPNQQYEAEFFWSYDGQVDPERPQWVELTLEISSETPEADLLLADNRRTILAPVLTAVPIVFVDQWGEQANSAKGQIGETEALQHLLAPRSTSEFAHRPLYQVIRRRIDELDQETLAQARCVVIAGIERPGVATQILLEYVRQGGPLLICAGGEFDPRGWMEDAWLDGEGLLPLPLETEFLGTTPEESPNQLMPFAITSESLNSELFQVEGEDPQAIKSLFESVLFFKAVKANASQESIDAILQSVQQRLAFKAGLGSGSSADQQSRLPAAQSANWWNWRAPITPLRQELQKLTELKRTEHDQFLQNQIQQKPTELAQPSAPQSRNLLASSQQLKTEIDERLSQLARRETPQVLARYSTDNLPFLIERQVEDGRVLFCTSGITSDWNLIRLSPAMFMYHRLLTQMASQSLPQRNFEAGSRIQWLAPTTSDSLLLKRPEGSVNVVSVEALSSDVYGYIVRRPVMSGLYEFQSQGSDASANPAPDASTSGDNSQTGNQSTASGTGKRAIYSVAVSAPAIESSLETLPTDELAELVASTRVRVLAAGEKPLLTGGSHRGQSLWQLAIGLMIASLLLEMFVASRRTFSGRKGAQP